MTDTKIKTFSFKAPKAWEPILEQHAQEEDVDVSKLIRRALRLAYDDLTDQAIPATTENQQQGA